MQYLPEKLVYLAARDDDHGTITLIVINLNQAVIRASLDVMTRSPPGRIRRAAGRLVGLHPYRVSAS